MPPIELAISAAYRASMAASLGFQGRGDQSGRYSPRFCGKQDSPRGRIARKSLERLRYALQSPAPPLSRARNWPAACAGEAQGSRLPLPAGTIQNEHAAR